MELNNIGESSESLQDVKAYLEGQMSGNIVFWEEDDVHEQILLWKIKKNTPAPSEEDNHEDDEPSEKSHGEERFGDNNAPDSESKRVRALAKEKIENSKNDCEKLYSVLMAITEKYPYILGDINDLL